MLYHLHGLRSSLYYMQRSEHIHTGSMHTQVPGYIYSLGAVPPINLLVLMSCPGFEATEEHLFLPEWLLAHYKEGGGRHEGPTLPPSFETTSPFSPRC